MTFETSGYVRYVTVFFSLLRADPAKVEGRAPSRRDYKRAHDRIGLWRALAGAGVYIEGGGRETVSRLALSRT